MSTEQQNANAPSIKSVVGQIAAMFHQVSGLPDFEELTCAYYCLSTYFVDKTNPFPLLAIMGPNGTGKSRFLEMCELLAFRPHLFSFMKLTPPAMRDKLGEAHDGTAILDEADTDGLESFLTLRYRRETAVCYIKIPTAGGWATKAIPMFGPSILHKRQPFADPAVDGRSILINTVANTDRVYTEKENISEDIIADLVVAQMKLRVSVKLPKKTLIPPGIAPRIADTYRPLIALASIENDVEFLEPLWERLRLATTDFTDGQAYEPGPIVVQALLSCLTINENMVIKNVKLEGELVKKIQYEFGYNLNSRQVAKILRSYGFTLKRIGGPFSVVPDLKTLIKVALAIGLEDEALERIAKGLKPSAWETENP